MPLRSGSFTETSSGDASFLLLESRSRCSWLTSITAHLVQKIGLCQRVIEIASSSLVSLGGAEQRLGSMSPPLSALSAEAV